MRANVYHADKDTYSYFNTVEEFLTAVGIAKKIAKEDPETVREIVVTFVKMNADGDAWFRIDRK